jgi:hypothetical protein
VPPVVSLGLVARRAIAAVDGKIQAKEGRWRLAGRDRFAGLRRWATILLKLGRNGLMAHFEHLPPLDNQSNLQAAAVPKAAEPITPRPLLPVGWHLSRTIALPIADESQIR